MKPGDIARLRKSAPGLSSSTPGLDGVILIIEIFSEGVTFTRCLNSYGEVVKIPLWWLENINEAG